MGLVRADGRAVARVELLRAEDVGVAEVTAFRVRDERDVFDPVLFVLLLLVFFFLLVGVFFPEPDGDVDVQFDFALFNKIYFLGQIPLLVKDVTLHQLERFEFRHEDEQEILVFILKEQNFVDDLAMCDFKHLASQTLRQVFEQLLLRGTIAFALLVIF